MAYVENRSAHDAGSMYWNCPALSIYTWRSNILKPSNVKTAFGNLRKIGQNWQGKNELNEHSHYHLGFDPLWALAQEAGLPILFHVGSEGIMVEAHFEYGQPRVKDCHGGDENFTSSIILSIPLVH